MPFLQNICLAFNVMGEQTKNMVHWRRECKTTKRLDGKVVVITGGNTGIGKETAYQLSLRGAKIIVGCRDIAKGDIAVKHIKEKNHDAIISVLKLDLSSLTSVRQFAESIAKQENKIDILINNAGVMMCPESKTEDGFEMQFGTNHLGHFLLTLSVLPLLKESPNARIVTVSAKLYVMSDIHFDNINLGDGVYTPLKGYAQSKLANILFTRELAKRLGTNSNIKTYCLHPGIIKTDLGRHVSTSKLTNLYMKIFFLNEEEGSQTTLYCALDDNLENESGHYYEDCKRVDKMSPKAEDDVSAQRLWELSSEFVKLEDSLKI